MYTKVVNDNYYRKTVCYDARLEYMPYGSCGVVIGENNSVCLYSYTTLVIEINREYWMRCTGLYSMTTRKHINAFLKEYCPKISFQDVKKAYENNYMLNVFTGEIINFEE